jgi:hypothetical protein
MASSTRREMGWVGVHPVSPDRAGISKPLTCRNFHRHPVADLHVRCLGHVVILISQRSMLHRGSSVGADGREGVQFQPTGDADLLSGDIAGVIAGQKGDHVRDSSGRPNRPLGMAPNIRFRFHSGIASSLGVAINPGRTQFAVIPSAQFSMATVRIMSCRPAFDAA